MITTQAITGTRVRAMALHEGFIYRLLTWSGLADHIQEGPRYQRYKYQQVKDRLGSGIAVPRFIGETAGFVPEWRPSHQIDTVAVGGRLSYLLTLAQLNRTPLTYQPSAANLYDYGRESVELLRLLTQLITDLTAEGRLSSQDFIEYLQPLQKLDPHIHETASEGIRLFFQEDYLPAAYILTLQLEDTVRHIARLTGHKTLEQTTHGETEKPLGRLLKHLKDHLPGDLYHHLVWVLKDYRGLNLRNAIAHGFFKKANTHPAISVALLHLFCLLVAWIEKSKEKV